MLYHPVLGRRSVQLKQLLQSVPRTLYPFLWGLLLQEGVWFGFLCLVCTYLEMGSLSPTSLEAGRSARAQGI